MTTLFCEYFHSVKLKHEQLLVLLKQICKESPAVKCVQRSCYSLAVRVHLRRIRTREGNGSLQVQIRELGVWLPKTIPAPSQNKIMSKKAFFFFFTHKMSMLAKFETRLRRSIIIYHTDNR